MHDDTTHDTADDIADDSSDESTTGLEALVSDLQSRVCDLETRLDDAEAEVGDLREANEELRAENERLREENEDLRERLADLDEYVHDAVSFGDADGPEDATLQDVHLGNVPVGSILGGAKNLQSTFRERITDLEEGRSDPVAEADPADTLPIQQTVRTYQSDCGTLKANQRRAAIVWENFFDYCTHTQGKFVLHSGRLRNILRIEEGRDPYGADVGRVIDYLTDLSNGLVYEIERNRRRVLVIDEDEFRSFYEDLREKTRRPTGTPDAVPFEAGSGEGTPA